MLAWRSEREPSSPASAPAIVRPAARRLTSLRTRSVAMTPNASVAAAANTSTLIISVGLSAPGNMVKIASMASNLEADHAVHEKVAEQHPSASAGQRIVREGDVPDARVIVGRHHLENE